MTRRRYVYREIDGEVHAVEVTIDTQPKARLEFSTDRSYEGLRATDGADIGSRRKHREYMHVHGLTTADDYTETWAKARKKRNEFFTRGGDAEESRARKEALGRAFYELQRRGRR